MSIIEYGGEPSIEQRRQFCNQEKGHIPGYTGFCPQFKFSYGKSFGKETSRISKELPYFHGPKELEFNNLAESFVSPQILLRNEGNNKYLADIAPGYSGKVPRMDYKFGKSYNKLCCDSINEFSKDYVHLKDRRMELQKIARENPGLNSFYRDPSVKYHMNAWNDDLLNNTLNTKFEPPIPGYQGFIPRLESTDAGLGTRFYTSAKKCLETFRHECDEHNNSRSRPIHRIDTSFARRPQARSTSPGFSRIYHQEGMVPDYKGHIQGLKFQTGKTFGNSTRTLDVCTHPYSNFGQYNYYKSF